MKTLLYCCTVLALLVALLACRNSTAVPPATAPEAQRAATEAPPQQIQIEDLFIEGDRLSYNGYEVVKRKKRVQPQSGGGAMLPTPC
jgi:hypothetical protein